MPLLLSLWTPAAAAALPWDCPAWSTPEEAHVYLDAGLPTELAASLGNELAAWWDPSACPLEADPAVPTCTAVTVAGAVLTYTNSSAYDWEPTTGSISRGLLVLTVDLPVGTADWTQLTLTESASSSTSGAAWGGSDGVSVTWVGSPLGLPADSSLSWWEAESTFGDTMRSWGVATPSCAYSGGSYTGDGRTWVATPTGDVTVYEGWVRCVSGDEWLAPVVAFVDGEQWAAVDADTWALAEVDLDGWSVADGDCDDADPDVYPCAPEVPYDGVDNDCAGGDERDADGDGVEAIAVGGDDCDDDNAAVWPGATSDPIGDGVDQDCDGSDGVDRDGDGATVASPGDDCDDDDASVHPGAPDVPYDGIDQDCDHHDLTDVDHDGVRARVAGGADCDDTRANVYPGAPELPCDGVDEDCDGADRCAVLGVWKPFTPARPRWR